MNYDHFYKLSIVKGFVVITCLGKTQTPKIQQEIVRDLRSM